MFEFEHLRYIIAVLMRTVKRKEDKVEIFAERIKECRKKAGFTQEKAAELLEIGYSTYRHYEYGNRVPLVTDAAAMAKLFHVSLDYLAGLTDDPAAR